MYARLVAPAIRPFYERMADEVPEGVRLVVDVGAGPGDLAAAIAACRPGADVVGVDLDPSQVRIAKRRHTAKNLEYREGAAQALPFADGSVDHVVTSESFHHWSEAAEGLVEIHRVLRPGASLWIIEGRGDMTRRQMHDCLRVPRIPGMHLFGRWVFRRHGYRDQALEDEVVPLLAASPFGGCEVEDLGAWWRIKAVK